MKNDDYEKSFEKEKAAFERLLPELLQDEKYKGKFVAVYKERVVDQDEDNIALAKRFYEKYGSEPVYFQLVSEKPRVFKLEEGDKLQKQMKQTEEDIKWAREHQQQELERYRGKTVYIYKGKVLGTLDEIDKLEKQGKLPAPRDEITRYWVDDGRIVTPFHPLR